MKRIFAVLPSVVVASGIAGWAVARTNFTDRVDARARAEVQAVRMESERVARHLVDQLAGADRAVFSRWPEKGGKLESVQDQLWMSQFIQIVGRAEFRSQRAPALWVSDASITCYRGSEPVLSLMPIGHVWIISAGHRSAEFTVSEADRGAMTALLSKAQPRSSSS